MILHRFSGELTDEAVQEAIQRSGRLDGMNLLLQGVVVALTRDFIMARGMVILPGNGHMGYTLAEEDLDHALEFVMDEIDRFM